MQFPPFILRVGKEIMGDPIECLYDGTYDRMHAVAENAMKIRSRLVMGTISKFRYGFLRDSWILMQVVDSFQWLTTAVKINVYY